ncbi:PREDICTED: dnaJ homolog subfamily C GRV2-like [Ipomoea nil]|uniref:dnaJ homolog subfamily C GRV2-like n=1 Tax=Ipomoea nil TaxID=35883 RepID=UPI0009017528|nr:PREDICTED: dnaJ homolog subfamily C GRV2-like [Ipomoea nil]XP_019158420.1 PREDICTED: dnaJ homolog subfamily C GRV2-like [Ipomoea nil]
MKVVGAKVLEDDVIESYGNDDEALNAAENGVAVVDLSHYGRIRVRGEGQVQFLHNQSTAYFEILHEGIDERFVQYRGMYMVGGCVLGVDLLTVVHEASERTDIPLQSNLIAATAFMEPLKEWMHVNNDGAQVGPVERMLL